MNFSEGLLIPEEKNILAFVGAGGKTGLIFRLASEYRELNKRVIITTTTHMAPVRNLPFIPDGDAEMLQRETLSVTGVLEPGSGKIRSLPRESFKRLPGLCDKLLIEADGSRGFPLKVPRAWEPVIPEEADLVIGILGVDVLGKPIREVSHHPELVSAFLGKDMDETVTPSDLALIASSERGLRKGVGTREYRVFLNRSDALLDPAWGVETLKLLQEKGLTACLGSLREGRWNWK